MPIVGTVTATGYGSTYGSAYRNATGNNINVQARVRFGSRASVGDVTEVAHRVITSRKFLGIGWGNGPDRHEVTVKGTVYLPKGLCTSNSPDGTMRYRGRVRLRRR